MITLVARWDDTQMVPEVEWRLWRQMKGAFKISRFVFVPVAPKMEGYALDQYNTMEEALESTTGERVFLEPSGYNPLHELPQGDIVMICGNSSMNNIEYATVDETYQIQTEGGIHHNHLCGSNAAAIALAIRHGQ